MKAWVHLLYAMFDERYHTYKEYLDMPNKTKKAMIKALKNENYSLKQVCMSIPAMDAAKANVSTLEELFELDVRGFDAQVIKGESKALGQVSIEEIIKFNPKVIKDIK